MRSSRCCGGAARIQDRNRSSANAIRRRIKGCSAAEGKISRADNICHCRISRCCNRDIAKGRQALILSHDKIASSNGDPIRRCNRRNSLRCRATKCGERHFAIGASYPARSADRRSLDDELSIGDFVRYGVDRRRGACRGGLQPDVATATASAIGIDVLDGDIAARRRDGDIGAVGADSRCIGRDIATKSHCIGCFRLKGFAR